MDFAPRPTFGGARVAFGRHAQTQDDGPPPAFRGKSLVRRSAMLRDAREAVDALPGPGEALHVVTTGLSDLMVLIVALIDLRPAPCRRLRLATLAFAARNLAEMLNLLERGKVGEITLLASCFHEAHNKALWAEARREFATSGKARIAAAHNHCKVCCLEWDDSVLVMEGSANVRTCHAWDNLCLINDKSLHDFHAKWIDAQEMKHAAKDDAARP
jgi:hypothetical protein